MSQSEEVTHGLSSAVTRLVLYIALYIVVSAFLTYLVTGFLPSIGIAQMRDYLVYANILLALGFGYLIVTGFSNTVYWSMRAKYEHSTAAAVRNVLKIIGIGAAVAAIAGGVAGGAAGVALGGFIGLVVGFASQQVLGQAVAGLFLLLARPFKISDAVNIAGEDGVVEDVSTLFTTVLKSDGVRVLVPNHALVGNKIYLKSKK